VLTRVCMATSFGGWMTGALWLVTRNAWVGVFACAVALGLYILHNIRLAEREAAMVDEVGELQKQVVGLRTTIDRMARLGEVERAMAGKVRLRHGRSDSSLSL